MSVESLAEEQIRRIFGPRPFMGDAQDRYIDQARAITESREITSVQVTSRLAMDIIDAGLRVSDYVTTHRDRAVVHTEPFPQVLLWS